MILFPNRDALLQTTPLLQLDPAVPGVFGGPYPFGIDPVRAHPSSAVFCAKYSVSAERKVPVCSLFCERFPSPAIPLASPSVVGIFLNDRIPTEMSDLG